MIAIDNLPLISGTYRENAGLSKTTWFGTGGAAEILFKPQDTEDLCNFIRQLDKSIPCKVIGVGSNLLVRDGGIRGVVIRLGRAFTEMRVEGNRIFASAAVSDYNLANFAMNNGLSGAEFLVGVPGLVGGGIFMNCGCYGDEISQITSYVLVVDEQGILRQIPRNEINFQYRCSNLPPDWIIVGAAFDLIPRNSNQIIEKMNQISEQRRQSQPIKEKTGGSTFKNPVGFKAWELIDRAGFRGYKHGGAMVSPLHCNFLINNDNAKASDLEELGEMIRVAVKDQFNIELEWEIKIIGDR